MSSSIRCLTVLELLAREPYELGLKGIAAELSLPMPTAHRLVATLVEAGFVEQEPLSRQYRLSGKALWTGAGFLRRSAVYHAAFLVMQDLMAQVRGLVHLGVLDADTVLYLHTLGRPHSAYLCADTGDRRPAHSTALGKALLAWQPDEQALLRIMAGGPRRFTSTTITTLAAMRADLQRTRKRGFALDREEGSEGLRCVAAPIFNKSGRVDAALSVATVNERPQTVMGPYARLVREAALKVSVQLGYRPAVRAGGVSGS